MSFESLMHESIQSQIICVEAGRGKAEEDSGRLMARREF
jgi:hypothetical protein